MKTKLAIQQLTAIASALVVAGCVGAVPLKKQPASKDPNFSYQKVDDPLLAQATQNARETFDSFREGFKERKPGSKTEYVVKFMVPGDKIDEFFWMHVTGLDGNKITGTVDSDGVNVKLVHRGDTMTTDAAKIADWKIDDYTTAHGGFSILALERGIIAEINGIDTSKADKGAAQKQDLTEHWQDLVKQARTEQKVSMYREDLSTLEEVQEMERLYKGNSEDGGTTQDIADSCGVPKEMVEAIDEFWSLRKGDFKRK